MDIQVVIWGRCMCLLNIRRYLFWVFCGGGGGLGGGYCTILTNFITDDSPAQSRDVCLLCLLAHICDLGMMSEYYIACQVLVLVLAHFNSSLGSAWWLNIIYLYIVAVNCWRYHAICLNCIVLLLSVFIPCYARCIRSMSTFSLWSHFLNFCVCKVGCHCYKM